MTAQIGADGLEVFGDPRPDLLAAVARVESEPGGEWVHLGRLGFKSTQRLRLAELGGGIVVASWPGELAPQARYLYGRRLAGPLISKALERGWVVEPSPHLAYHTAPPARRLYMRPAAAPSDYAGVWEEGDGLRRIGNYTREEVEGELWPWLKEQGFASEGDDAELEDFLDRFLLRRPAHMRPGFRLRKVWAMEEVAELGPVLADAIRTEFDAVFSAAEEPSLVGGPRAQSERQAKPLPAERGQGFVREAIPERVRHEVWRRDGGRCVDCGSRERLEFDHIIPVSKGGSNTARNIELRCEACNRRKSAAI